MFVFAFVAPSAARQICPIIVEKPLDENDRARQESGKSTANQKSELYKESRLRFASPSCTYTLVRNVERRWWQPPLQASRGSERLITIIGIIRDVRSARLSGRACVRVVRYAAPRYDRTVGTFCAQQRVIAS